MKGRGFLVAGATLLMLFVVALAVNFWMAGRAAHPDPAPMSDDPENALDESENPVDWGYWQTTNPDVVAWIEVPGTDISQPVVQAPSDDPLYYLTHDVYRQWDWFGCPYIDANCPSGMDSWNVVISGHNISTPPAMFHDVECYHDADYARAHEEVRIYRPSGLTVFNVIAVTTIGGWEQAKRVKFSSPSDFQEYRRAVLGSADTVFEHEEKSGQLLTLCSCSYFYTPNDERTLVFAQ